MSEKRFVHNEEESYESCWDNQEQDVLWVSEMIDLLNSLYDENEQLRQSIDFMIKKSAEISTRNIVLHEKIGELQRKLKEKEEDEKLYANERVELNKTKKELIEFKELGGDY